MYKVYSTLEECKAYWEGVERETKLSDDRYEIIGEIIEQLGHLMIVKGEIRPPRMSAVRMA
jgi:hypothetical protein